MLSKENIIRAVLVLLGVVTGWLGNQLTGESDVGASDAPTLSIVQPAE